MSYEPALGGVLFGQLLPGLHWIVVGGESGPRARMFFCEWARSVITECRDAGVPCFVKQLGAKPREGARVSPPFVWPSRVEVLTDGWGQVRLTHRKGGEPSEWPEELRVRQWPAEWKERACLSG